MARLCRARLTVPSSDGHHNIIFECNEQRGHAEDNHRELGRVRGADGKVREYSVFWSDARTSIETWRQPAPPLDVSIGPRAQAIMIEDLADADD